MPRIIKQNPLGKIVGQQTSYLRCISGRQQSYPQILCANRVGLFFFIVLALIVSAHRHRKTEPDDESQQRQGSRQGNVEILTCAFTPALLPRANERPEPTGEPQNQKRRHRKNAWRVHKGCHRTPSWPCESCYVILPVKVCTCACISPT